MRTARVHHAARRRGGGVAARGARAAAERMRRDRRARPASAEIAGHRLVAAFAQGLQELGWADGRNIAIEYRWADGRCDRCRSWRPNWSRSAPDRHLSPGAHAGGRVAASRRRTIPIVFVDGRRSGRAGFVASLARPGGNVTGFTVLESTIGGKWLELLKEIAPRVARVAVLFNPGNGAVCRSLPGLASEPPPRPSGWRSIAAPVRDTPRLEARRCRIGARAAWWPHRQCRCLHDHSSRGDRHRWRLATGCLRSIRFAVSRRSRWPDVLRQ